MVLCQTLGVGSTVFLSHEVVIPVARAHKDRCVGTDKRG